MRMFTFFEYLSSNISHNKNSFITTKYIHKKINIKTNLLEEYVNFFYTTKKQNKYFKKFIILNAIIYF